MNKITTLNNEVSNAGKCSIAKIYNVEQDLAEGLKKKKKND